MSREFWLWPALAVGGFLLGSVMFSAILPRLLLGRDIAGESDDHNPGATNVFVLCGAGMGLLCLCLDMLKGFFPVFAARELLGTENMLFAAVVAAPVLGHAIAPLNRFHGGKCIATAFGVTLGLWPASHVCLVLAAAYILFSTLFKIESHRKRSIVAFAVFGLVSVTALLIEKRAPIALGCGLVAMTVIIRHVKSTPD